MWWGKVGLLILESKRTKESREMTNPNEAAINGGSYQILRRNKVQAQFTSSNSQLGVLI